MTQKPDVTVAAVVERHGRFLLVQERVARRLVLNQPAGHLEQGESLLQAVAREAREETGHAFAPRAVTGIYLWRGTDGRSFLRVAFSGELGPRDAAARLDRSIVRTAWLRRDELAARGGELRSPLVLACVDDYLRGVRYPLELLTHVSSGEAAVPAAAAP